MNQEKAILEMMKERRTLKQLGLKITDLREIKKLGYNIKADTNKGNTYYWIKDTDEKNGAVIISPKSSKLETLIWAEISDTHAGSQYFDPKALDLFLKIAEEEYGIKHVHHSGDLVDGVGVYSGQQNWLKYWRQTDQVDCLAEVLNKHKLDYIVIEGNHDFSWIRRGAPRVGELLKQRVPNLIYLPAKSDKVVRGDIVIAGTLKRIVHPWSAGGRTAYAMSYPAQTYLRNVFQHSQEIEVRDKKYKLSFLQYGHLHYDMELTTFGVHCTFPMSFQHGNDYTEGMGLGGKIGGRITKVTVQDGEILDYDSKSIYMNDRK